MSSKARFLLFLTTGAVLTEGHALELHDFTAEAISNDIMDRLGMPDYKERLSVEKIPGFGELLDVEKFGYITTDKALMNCEEGIRSTVETEVERLRAIAVEEFLKVGNDLEKRCRSYAEFGLGECRVRVDSLAGQLKTAGKQLFTDELFKCRGEVIDVAENEKDSEEIRLRTLGELETEKFTRFYTDLGKVQERKIREEFKEREKIARKELEEEFIQRGKEQETLIREEYRLKGEIFKIEINQTTTERGFRMMQEIRKEFEEKGEKFEKELKKEFEEKGKNIRKDLENNANKEVNELKSEGEKSCIRMAEKACENVIFDTVGDDTCLNLDFFGGGGKRRKRKAKSLSSAKGKQKSSSKRGRSKRSTGKISIETR